MFIQYRTVLHFMIITEISPSYLNNVINPSIQPLCLCMNNTNFVFMVDNALAHSGHINRNRLLETRVPEIEWPVISPVLNPIRLELQNLNDFKATVQDDWDAMPCQQHETLSSN